MSIEQIPTEVDLTTKKKTWFTRKNIAILSSMVGFIVILAIIAASGTDMGSIFQDWTNSYYIAYGIVGLFLILFLISTFANMTVLFPIPYGVALAFVAIAIPLTDADIWLLGITAGIGAAIGEITAYYLGKGSAKLLESEEGRESVRKMKERINKGYAVPLMYLCAATFIPDDPYLILLGYAGYPLWKMLVTYFFGKITLCVTTLYLAKVAITNDVVRGVLKILGVTLPGDTPVDPWISFVGWVGVLILFFLIFYIDWTSKFKTLYKKLFKRK
ncbi:MAG: VTT domain-containing protein [Candidatus Helarchaeota archaeon]